MPSDFLARPLEAAQVLQAYPLVQALDPSLTLERWQAFADDVRNAPGDPDFSRIMTLQTASGYLHGLFIYRIYRDLRDGRRLHVDYLVTFELPGQLSALKAAIRVIEQLGRENRCEAISVNMPATRTIGRQTGSKAFADNGYEVDATCWCKRLMPNEISAATIRSIPRASRDL